MNATIQTLRSLHSTHGNFGDREIPDADLQAILDTCVLAANASNKQSYSIVVVKDRERMKVLTPYVGSVALVFCADFTRLKKTAVRLQLDYSVPTLMPFLTAYTDTCLVAQTAAVRGTCTRDRLAVHQRHPSGRYPACLSEPGVAGEAIVHHETHKPLSEESADAIISRYDDPGQHLAPTTQWAETHDHFLSWFFDVWTNRIPTEAGRSQLFEALLAAGFLSAEFE